MNDDAFSTVQGSAEEIRDRSDYFYDNSRRGDVNRLVVQRTLEGAGFLRANGSEMAVTAGHAMLFTHRERSCYGYPEGAVEAYRQRFLAVSPGGGLQLVFDRIRRDFGAVVSMPDSSEATAIFNETFERFHRHSFRDRLHQSELLYRLLIAVYREQVMGTRSSDPIEFGYHHLRNAFQTLQNVKQIAGRCGLSREHFIRAFKRRYGESPGAMLQRLRLEHAKAMLSTTNLPIEEIAIASGFTGSNTFCRAYRRRFDCTASSTRTPIGVRRP